MSEELKTFDADQPQDNVYAGVHQALTVGMYVSTPLFVIGVALALLNPPGRLLSAAELKAYYHPVYLAQQIAHFDANAVLMLATLAMILTPIARVVVSLIAFAKDGDRKFVGVTGIVLVTIALAVVLGLLGWA